MSNMADRSRRSTWRQVKGATAEKVALERLLASPGMKTLARNFRRRVGEIDLILEERLATGGCELVFVEVRARARDAWVDGVQSVDWRKRAKIEMTAAIFLRSYRGAARSVRFDVMAWNGTAWTHIRDAWRS